MRSITKHRNRKRLKPLLLVGILLVLVTLGVIFYSKYSGQGSTADISERNPINTEAPTPEQIEIGSEIKERSLEKDSAKSTGHIKVEILPPAIDEGTMKVQSILRTMTNNGICTLLLSRSGQATKEYTAGVQALSSYSTCKGFTVNTSELAPGTWLVQLIYRNGAVESSAEIKVKI